MNNHPNSRKVTIYRKDSFAVSAQRDSAADFIALSKKSIGSYWENSFSKASGSGLSFEEQKILMPHVVNCEPEDKEFRKLVAAYFASIKTEVPFEKGRTLEVGLEKDNNKPVSANNMPINLGDYLAYRHALKHPLVAANRKEGNMLKEYYIFDANEEERVSAQEGELRDKALEQYLKIIKQPEKIDMLLTLLGEDPRKLKGNKLAQLRKLAESDAKKFIETLADKFFEDQYVILTMVNLKLLTKVGERILDPETGETLGHDMRETVAWFRDKKNNDRVVLLKARMQEGLSSARTSALEKAL